LGPKLIHLITRKEVQALLNKKADDGCPYSLVQHLHSFMSEIFEMTLADRLIEVDPARTTVIPKCKAPKPKPVMTPEDVERVEKSLDIRERLIFWLATGGGRMRPGEIEGLKVETSRRTGFASNAESIAAKRGLRKLASRNERSPSFREPLHS